MRRASILPIAVMAFAVAAFIFVIAWAVSPGLKWPWSTKVENTANTNTGQVVNTPIYNTNSPELTPQEDQQNANIGPTHGDVDATADWKTYTDSTHGFSFKYPTNWTLDTKPALSVGAGVTAPTTKSLFYVIPDGSTTDDSNVISTETVTLAGQVAKKTVRKNLGATNLPNYDYYVLTTYRMNGWTANNNITSEPKTSADIETLRIILSTLVITDPTAGWKTYTDTKYGYSFKYPSNWSLQTAHADDPKNVFGTEYALVTDPANSNILFEVCPTSQGCLVTQDAQYTATTSQVTVGNKMATQSDWTVVSSANCTSCSPATTIKFSTPPTSWTGERNILLRAGSDSSTVPKTILSTFTFT